MSEKDTPKKNIAVVGLGYVGLPVACEFSKLFNVIAYDIENLRIEQLKNNIDITDSYAFPHRKKSHIKWTSCHLDLEAANFFIVCVPTPIDDKNLPNITCIIKASEVISLYLRKGSAVIFESTVYPGTTSTICRSILEKKSALKANVDFQLGYSPERICPGDEVNKLINTDKILACDNKASLKELSYVYSKIYKDKLHLSTNTKSAEAAKLLENIQRDVNIALMNEMHQIFMADGIDTYEVLRLASSKWNFSYFEPGLVGGHCISVDPYYHLFYAEQLGFSSPIVSLSRKVNEEKKDCIFKSVEDFVTTKLVKDPIITIFGVTYKENCFDVRNSQAILIYNKLAEKYKKVQVNDVKLSKLNEVLSDSLSLIKFDNLKKSDVIIICVAHDDYKRLTINDFLRLTNIGSLIIDVKNCISKETEYELNKYNINVSKG